MRVAYGVHGYGRGHAMRALAVLPQLATRHEVLILAGADACCALQPEYSVVRLPTLQYRYDRRGKLSGLRSLWHNAPAVADLVLGGPALQMVIDTLADFRPDVVISDSEAFTHRAARRLGIPRISFDNFGVLVHCAPRMAGFDHVRAWGNGLAYRWMFGKPDRVIISSFMRLPSRRPDVCVVGSVIREEVQQVRPRRGNHLLVYLSKGEHEYGADVEKALLALDCPVLIYGTGRRGMHRNLQFKPLANLPFIEDLASCRAVLGTTGNQLLGEAIYFGKPVLGMPIDCLEQRMNAAHLERLGIGMQIAKRRVNADVVRAFLAREEQFIRNMPEQNGDSAQAAVDAIERFAAELCAGGAEVGSRHRA